MKLIRYRENQKEKTGVVLNDSYYDTSAFGQDYNEDFFATDGVLKLQRFVDENKQTLKTLPATVSFASPIARPSKLVCIGLNYTDHAKETGATPPAVPVIFMKATTALCGPFDDIVIPKNSVKTDWEVELAVVIG